MIRKIATTAAATATALGLTLGLALPAGAAADYAAHPGTRTTGYGNYTAYNARVSFKAYYDAAHKVVRHTVTLTDLNCDTKRAAFLVRGYTGPYLRYFAEYYLKNGCRSSATVSFTVSVADRRTIWLVVGNYGGPWSSYRLITFYP